MLNCVWLLENVDTCTPTKIIIILHTIATKMKPNYSEEGPYNIKNKDVPCNSWESVSLIRSTLFFLLLLSIFLPSYLISFKSLFLSLFLSFPTSRVKLVNIFLTLLFVSVNVFHKDPFGRPPDSN